MPKSAASGSPLSTGSGLSGRYDVVCSSVNNERCDSAAADTNDDDIYGASEYATLLLQRAGSTAASQPPMLEPVRRSPLPPHECSPLVGFSPLRNERRAVASRTNSNVAANASLLAADDARSTASACSRQSEVESKSERHRRYAQAVQTPLMDTSGVTAFARSIRQSSNHSNCVDAPAQPSTEAQSARVEQQEQQRRTSTRPAAPVTTSIAAASARRPSGVRLKPLILSRGDSAVAETTTCNSSSGGNGSVVEGEAAAAAATHCEGRTRTPVERRAAPNRLVAPVASAPSCLPSSLTGRGVPAAAAAAAARSSFLSQPLQRSGVGRANAAEGEDGILLHHQQRVDATLVAAARDPRRRSTDREASETGREASVGSTVPHAIRGGASRSGSGVFSMHTLVSRSKNVDNFDYGLSALGFPVEGQQRQPPQQQASSRTGEQPPSSPMPGSNSAVTFLVAAGSHHSGIGGGGGGLMRSLPSAGEMKTPATLPSLMTQRRLSGLQETGTSPLAGGGGGAAVSGGSPKTSVGSPRHRLQQQPVSSPSPRAATARLLSREGSTEQAAAAPIAVRSVDLAKQKSTSPRSAGTPPPRPPPIAPHDAVHLLSPTYKPQPRISHSPSLRSLEETKAAIGSAYDEATVPTSSASNLGTIRSSTGSSGALESVSLRSIVLQPRRLPRNIGDVYDLRGGDSGDCFDVLRRSSGSGVYASGSDGNSVQVARTGVHVPPHQLPTPGVETPDLLSPKMNGRRAAAPPPPPPPRFGSFGDVLEEMDREMLLGPSLSQHDEDDSLLFDDVDASDPDGNDAAPSPSQQQQHLGNASEDGAAVHALLSPLRRDAKAGDRDAKRHESRPSLRDTSAGMPEAPCASRETFLPFEEVAAVGSRGFSSLMLTSFLRHAGSTEPVWTPTSSGVVWSPHRAASLSSSPPSSMAATVTGVGYGSQRASLSSQMSVPFSRGAAMGDGAVRAAEDAPLPNVSAPSFDEEATGPLLGAPQLRTASSGSVPRVPAPPRVTSARTSAAKSPRDSLGAQGGPAGSAVSTIAGGSDNSSGNTCVGSERKLPAELTRAGILRWAKPLSADLGEGEKAAAAAAAAPGSTNTTPTGAHLLRQLELSNHGAWQDVRGLTLLEHRTPAPTAATRVYAVDNGYAVRVVQNDLVGDCETDECVERCAAAVEPQTSAKDHGNAAAVPPLVLPSVLVDDAVRRFLEDGENAIAVVMDTASDYETRHPSTVMKGRAAAAPKADPPISSGVGQALSRTVVEAFQAFKARVAKANPGVIADLKVAVALIPVLHDATPRVVTPLFTSSPAVFYDAVGVAATEEESRRPLDIATSPIFGTCLNGCQWLVVEDESDINAAFSLLSGLRSSHLQGQQSFLYIQFLHQCFIPGGDAANTASGAPRGVAGFARRRKNADGAATGTLPPLDSRLNSKLSDIVVSSFTIAVTRSPQVIEVLLDQRADTPWPLLRYALGKGPSTVLGVVRVHDEDEEAAYPLSLLQRLKSLQHPCPRRGSFRSFVAEQRTKMTDLRRRLSEAEQRVARTGMTAAARATTKRLSVLISKLECSTKDAEDFLLDPEAGYVPVYVDACQPQTRRMRAAAAAAAESSSEDAALLPCKQQQQQQQQQTMVPRSPQSPHAPQRPASVALDEPLLLAMIQQYDPLTDTVKDPVTAGQKGTARWTLSPRESAAGSAPDGHQRQQLPSPRTLTAWVTLTKSVAFAVDEVTALGGQSEGGSQLSHCATWRQLGARVRAGCNAAAVVVQERQEASRLWSLRVALEMVHSVLKDTWSRQGPVGNKLTAAATVVVRVAVSVYHMSGSAVADLLRSSSTSRVTTGRSAAGSVTFTPATLAVRPLTGAAAPMNVTCQVVESLSELEAVLRVAVERLRTAQSAVETGAVAEGSAADVLAQRSLRGPGYTVATVELTQRVAANEADADADVLVSALSVVDLGGHFSLLRDATEARAALDKADAIAVAERTPSSASSASQPTVAAALLARLLVKRHDLVVCAAALPSVPTASTAYGLMGALKDFQQNAARAPHLHTTVAPGSVRRLVAHLQQLVQAESQQGAAGHDLGTVRSALRRAQAVLRDPHANAFVSYPYTRHDAEAMELPAGSRLILDTSAVHLSSLMERQSSSMTYHNSSIITTVGTVSTVGCSGSSPEMSAVHDGQLEKSATLLQQDTQVAFHNASVKPAQSQQIHPQQSAVNSARKRGVAEGRLVPPPTSGKEKAGAHGSYFGTNYSDHDAVMTVADIARTLTRGSALRAGGGGPEASASLACARQSGAPPRIEEEGRDAEAEPEPVRMPSVLVLNAATTGAYVRRHGTRIRVPLPSSSGLQFASYAADEVVNIKPTSTGLKSSLLMRTVSCVAKGRTAALLISDTEPCDAASCIAWLTLRTVMGGIFQTLKMREVEGVRHCATLRAFLMEEGHENELADLLAPCLTAAQPRHVLTRLKHSPFCGPVPADATARPVKDLQDVNAALGSALAAAKLARHSSAAEPLRGAIALQLTFHQFIPATAAGETDDVVVSSLWCVQMGCSAGLMEGLRTAPGSSTAALLRYWMGGPCYTTSVVGLSRFNGVRMTTWKELVGVQRRLREVPLRVPRFGSVWHYVAALEECLHRADATAAARGLGSSEAPDERVAATNTLSSSSASSLSSPTRREAVGDRREKASATAAATDGRTRVTALLREARRMLGRGPELGQSTQPWGQLAHEAKTFAALD